MRLPSEVLHAGFPHTCLPLCGQRPAVCGGAVLAVGFPALSVLPGLGSSVLGTNPLCLALHLCHPTLVLNYSPSPLPAGPGRTRVCQFLFRWLGLQLLLASSLDIFKCFQFISKTCQL